jgi:hypothetical protein
MKALKYLIVLAVIFIAGCEKDDTMLEGNRANGHNDIELKRANVSIPIQVDCWAVYHDLLPGRLKVGGTGSHFGKINPEESFYQFMGMVEDLDQEGVGCMRLWGFGKMVGANGDGMEFTFVTYQYPDRSFTSKGLITPGTGTGKFKGATGLFDIYGGGDDTGIWFKGSGYMIYE